MPPSIRIIIRMCLIAPMCSMAVAQVAPAGSRNPDDAQALLARVQDAYRLHPNIEVRLRRAAEFTGTNAQEVVKQAEATPGVNRIVEAETGRKLFEITRVRIVCASNGSIREEIMWLTLGQPAPTSFAPSVFTLGSPTETAQFSKGAGDEVEVRVSRGVSRAERLALHKKGAVTSDFEYATRAFPSMATWVCSVLADASDATISASDSNSATVESKEFGLTVTVNSRSAELERVVYASALGGTWSWRWEGTLPGEWFPARFPKTEYKSFAMNHDPLLPGDIIFYDSVEAIPPPAADEFSWKSLAPFGYMRGPNTVIDRNGVVDPVRTERRKGVQKQIASLMSMGPSPVAVSPPARGFYTAAGVMSVAVVGLWIRSKLS